MIANRRSRNSGAASTGRRAALALGLIAGLSLWRSSSRADDETTVTRPHASREAAVGAAPVSSSTAPTGAMGIGAAEGKKELDVREVTGPDVVTDIAATPADAPAPPAPAGPSKIVGPGRVHEASRSTSGGGAPGSGIHTAVVAIANERGVVCSGTLIGKTTVLTAKHCLPARRVLFGPDTRRPSAVRTIARSLVPPASAIDVALVFLDQPASVEPYPWRRRRDDAAPRGAVRLVGYGVDRAGAHQSAGIRRYVDVAVEGWGCDARRAFRAGCHEATEMVIPRRAGSDTCSGDSGGPVLEAFGDGYRIVAVTSRAVADSLLACGDGGIYTRADRISAWLERNAR
ncbi:trypsin-like serine protease [Sorangium cellulosum]|uniref:S1 family peptidase n=1 Tax=Sorangium cellulosum TaxID=56 RepID=UPI003D9A8F28